MSRDAAPADAGTGSHLHNPPLRPIADVDAGHDGGSPIDVEALCARELAGEDLHVSDHDAGSAAQGDDAYGGDACRPLPERLIVLGDSIASCAALPEGANSTNCVTQLIASHVRERFAPDLVLEDHSVAGARTADLPRQAMNVAAGEGHVWVFVYAIGNDLGGAATLPPEQLLLFIASGVSSWRAAWQAVFDYFGDRGRFPGGVTYLLNTQYSPNDLCPDPGPGHAGISELHEGALRCVNRLLFLDVAEARTDAVAVDQYPDWLGHGNNFDVPSCPYYVPGAQSWMAQAVHPNALGNRHLAENWFGAIDGMRAGCP
jgi:hypothetical protein